MTDNGVITSYGIILIRLDSDNNPWYLISQRRDSVEYIDILRGKYTTSNMENYIRLMTKEEQERILKYSFDELWSDLWTDRTDLIYKNSKIRAEQKYEANKEIIKHLIDKNPSTIIGTIWEFPKGRKNYMESEIHCAFREFEEETRIKIGHSNLLPIPPLVEIYKGTDGKMYKTVYYIALTEQIINIEKIKMNGIRKYSVSDEIGDLAWHRYEETRKLLASNRQKLLQDANKRIKEYISSTCL